MRDLCRTSGLAEVPVAAAAAAAVVVVHVVVVVRGLVVVALVVVVDGNVTMASSLVGGCCTLEEDDVGRCPAVALSDSFSVISSVVVVAVTVIYVEIVAATSSHCYRSLAAVHGN